ncbi:MAG: IPT/TIG domain-containing protein, partial [Planctomycetota bacterium]
RSPTISSINPNNGPQAGGTSVTITGTNFTHTTSEGPSVKIGGISASNVVLVSTTSITCDTPVGTAGAKDVVVTVPDGQSATLTNGFTYNP